MNYNQLDQKSKIKYKRVSGIHYKIEKLLGTPNYCEKCKASDKKIYDWANIDHKYKFVLSDWIRLCRSCHQKMDFSNGLRKKQIENKNATRLKVIQKTLDDLTIDVFNCISEASRKTNISRTAIINNLKGRSNTAGGFVWKY
jgi:NUMOD1 domain